MKKWIIFCRSTFNNIDKALESLEKQEKECINLCELNWIEVVLTYKEDFYTQNKHKDSFFNKAINNFRYGYETIDYFIFHYVSFGIKKDHCVFSNISKWSKKLNDTYIYPNRKYSTSVLPIEDIIDSYYNQDTDYYNQNLEENKYNTITYPKSTKPSPTIGVSEFWF